jgi:hypothetical protein
LQTGRQVQDIRARSPHWKIAAAGLATAVTLVPILVVVIGRAGHRYFPTQDYAVMDLRVRDVWSGDLPLTGVYSRFGWNHPGAILLLLLAPLNALFGGASWTTLVGQAALQGVAVVGTAWTAWRRGGLAVVLGALATVLLTYVAIADRLLFQPWNPNVVVFFPWFVLAAWGVALGDRTDLVVGAVLATFLAQSHVGYIPLVGALGLTAATFAIKDARAAHSGRTWRRPLLVALGATILLWLPAVYEQITDSPGNLRKIADYFLHNDEARAGLWKALGWLGAEYRVRPPWLGGVDFVNPFTLEALPMSRAWLLIPACVVVAALVVSARRDDRVAFRLVVLTAVANIVGAVSLAGVTGTGFPYLFYWRVPLAALTLSAGAWALARGLGAFASPAARLVGGVALAGPRHRAGRFVHRGRRESPGVGRPTGAHDQRNAAGTPARGRRPAGARAGHGFGNARPARRPLRRARPRRREGSSGRWRRVPVRRFARGASRRRRVDVVCHGGLGPRVDLEW